MRKSGHRDLPLDAGDALEGVPLRQKVLSGYLQDIRVVIALCGMDSRHRSGHDGHIDIIAHGQQRRRRPPECVKILCRQRRAIDKEGDDLAQQAKNKQADNVFSHALLRLVTVLTMRTASGRPGPTVRLPHHTPCRFTEKMLSSRLVRDGRRRAAASRPAFFNGKTLYLYLMPKRKLSRCHTASTLKMR